MRLSCSRIEYGKQSTSMRKDKNKHLRTTNQSLFFKPEADDLTGGGSFTSSTHLNIMINRIIISLLFFAPFHIFGQNEDKNILLMRRVVKIVMIIFFLNFFILFTFSQNSDNIVSEYLKRVEHNMFGLEAVYNLKSKGDVEKLLLGDFNAPVECFIRPDNGIPSSLRLVKGSSFWYLEVKHISNFFGVKSALAAKYPTITDGSSASADEVHNNDAVYAKRTVESLTLYKVDTLSFPISNRFAEQLYERMVSLIVNFKVKGFPQTCLGCYAVSFRVVIDDEVWSLWIHAPKGGNVFKMFELCRQIMSDALLDNELNEAKYMTGLNSFEN